jgi:hypothetical protein
LVLVGMTAVDALKGAGKITILTGKEEKKKQKKSVTIPSKQEKCLPGKQEPSFPVSTPLYKLTPRYPILELQALPLSKTLHRPAARSTTYGQPLRLENGSVVSSDGERVIFLLAAEALSCEGVETPQGDIIEFVDSNTCIYASRLHLRNSDSQAYPTSHL